MSKKQSYPSSLHRFSRREFLKVGGLGLLGLLFPPIKQVESRIPIGHLDLYNQMVLLPTTHNQFETRILHNAHPNQQGRVLDAYLYVYRDPSFESERVKTLWRDDVVPLTGVTVREDTPSHNLVWYRIGEDGYAHSGSIQPVYTILNEPSSDIPQGGMLAEVTVPFTDSRVAPRFDARVAYRFYYGTTHWVIQLVYDNTPDPWYVVLDDKWEFIFYVPARHLRLVPNRELGSLSPGIPDALKRLEVHLEQQYLIAYEVDQPVFMARIASGGRFRDGTYTTKTGRFLTFHKRPSRHMAAGNLAASGYDLPGVPWICYITESGVSFHGTYWHNNYGHPRSHGCINLTIQAAKWVYLWTLPAVPPEKQLIYEKFGTAVDVME